MKIYPNPTSATLNIEFSVLYSLDLELEISNTIGQSIFKEILSSCIGKSKKKINLNKFPKGIYFLKLNTKEGTINKKIILQ